MKKFWIILNLKEKFLFVSPVGNETIKKLMKKMLLNNLIISTSISENTRKFNHDRFLSLIKRPYFKFYLAVIFKSSCSKKTKIKKKLLL